jgi:hypothetical protein
MHYAGRLHGMAPLAAALVVLAPACGHRGDPLPPLRKTPPPLQEFRLAQRGEALELSVLAPAASVDGIAYTAPVVEFLFAQGDKDIEKAGERREVEARPGERVVVTLPLPAPGTVARAAARGVFGRESGPRTLIMALLAQTPPAAPTELAATLVADAVSLSWHGVPPEPVVASVLPTRIPGLPEPFAGPGGPLRPTIPSTAAPVPGTPQPAPGTPRPAPPGALPGAPAGVRPSVPDGLGPEAVAEPPRRKAGFVVYRRAATGSYARPLTVHPLAEGATSDASAPQGVTVCYVVRAASSLEPLVESAPSNEVCLDVKDIVAPAAPTGLAVLPRAGGLEVLWNPSRESDVAGYRVYRAVEGEAPARVAEVEATLSAWLDATAARGVSYRYTLTAFDRSGNESPPAEASEASLP